jgi:hypothetical protein
MPWHRASQKMPQTRPAHTYFFGRGSSEYGVIGSQAGILADALEQFARFNLERTGELHDIFNPEVPFAAFNPTDVRRMQARLFGKLFLRPFLFQSQLPNSFSKKSESSRRTPSHRRVLFRIGAVQRHRP